MENDLCNKRYQTFWYILTNKDVPFGQKNDFFKEVIDAANIRFEIDGTPICEKKSSCQTEYNEKHIDLSEEEDEKVEEEAVEEEEEIEDATPDRKKFKVPETVVEPTSDVVDPDRCVFCFVLFVRNTRNRFTANFTT